MRPIDLNADLGEGAAFDTQLLEIVSSASIACGGHAGDEETMEATLRAAQANRVCTGAHPGFADPAHFGRRELNLPVSETCDQVLTQIDRLLRVAARVNQPVSYLKLHGALYNMASRDLNLSRQLFTAVQHEFGDLPVLALANSAQIDAAKSLGLVVIAEGFADRAYDAHGQLVSRSQEGAVLHDPAIVREQAVRVALEGQVASREGAEIGLSVQSICLHGDNLAALELAHSVRNGLEEAGISIRAAV